MRTIAKFFLAVVFLAAPSIADADELYKIEPGDTLDISVLEDPNLNRQVLVRPDGRISLPIAGSIKAEGLSPEGVQSVIRRRLASDFEILPTVTVALVSTGSGEIDEEDMMTIFVMGEVRRPGIYEVEAPVNMLQALSVAGGLDRFAAPARVQLRRNTETGETITTFDYEAVEDGLAAQIVDLEDGDVIIVPERGLFE